MVSSQCGIPLITPAKNSNRMSDIDSFLTSATCMSDLLKKEDYFLSYFGGADLSFAGKDKFYATHKFDEVYGLNELINKTENKEYKNNWGLYDDTLLDITYKRFIKLSKQKEKFALFTLTLDTHHPKGHISKSCKKTYQDGSNPILNAVACSDFLITEFANKIINSPYGANTIIVISSDHLALNNSASKLLDKTNRTNLFMIIDSEKTEKNIAIDKLGSTLDLAPTILPYLGFNAQVGLGRNLLSKNYSKSEIEYIQKSLPNFRKSIASFWDYPKIKNTLKINIKEDTFFIDNNEFRLPVLIELDNELQTTLKFGYKPQLNNLLSLYKNEYFILINKEIEGNYNLISGSNNCNKKVPINNNIELTKEEIHKLICMKK